MCVKKCVKRFFRDEYMHRTPRFCPKIEGFFIFSEPTSNGLTVRSSFYATFMGLYGLIWQIPLNQRPSGFYIVALPFFLHKKLHKKIIFSDFRDVFLKLNQELS